MSDHYDKMISRLIQYRKSRGIKQEEAGSMAGVTQSHYSKIELRKTLLSGEGLLNLFNEQWDIEVIITGCERKVTELDAILESCEPDRRPEMLQLIIWSIRQEVTRQLGEDKTSINYNEIKVVSEEENPYGEVFNVWNSIRKIEGKTQIQMAELLNINIKKYREIEKGNRRADAEILINLYEKMGYSPLLILTGEVKNLRGINNAWIKFDEKAKERILEFLNIGKKLIDAKSR